MSEIRKVVGVFEDLVGTKDGISFPSVRAWIRGRNSYETHDLRRQFPSRGTVFLHVSACNNRHPERHQVGLFNCVENPGESAEWEVESTSTHLAMVLEYLKWGKNPDPLAFSQWLNAHHDTTPCNILQGTGQIYVTRGKRELVGPFFFGPDGKLTVRGLTYLYEAVDPISFDLLGHRRMVIDTELLPKGKPLIVDPRDAMHRRLKLASQTEKVNWLSRDKMRELSAALATVASEDGSEWIISDMSRALEVLTLSDGIDEKFISACLELEAVAKTIEAAWKKSHLEAVKKAQEEIEALKKGADGIRQNTGGLNKEVGRLNGEVQRLKGEKAGLEKTLLELQAKIEAAKVEAGQVFESELKRLAQSPVSMALLGAWMGGGHKSAERPAERSEPLIRIQRPVAELPKSVDFKSAIFNNFKSYNLSPLVATELTAVCRAALAAGQPIAFRSLFADLLADAVASALGQAVTVLADVPAGLLDPVDWERLVSSEHKGCPRILQNANRSDIPLVLGSLRRAVLEQALGNKKPEGVVLMTLETNAEMRVTLDYPIGPLIDERVLRFNAGKAVAGLSVFPEFSMQLPKVGALAAEEFAEIGDSLRRLPLFALSAHEIVFRRAFAALRETADKPGDVPRLFFKYWCLPRCGPEDVVAVLEAHKDTWGSDKSLMDLGEACNRNG